MSETVISLSEAAENLRRIVERARSESVSFVMTDNGVPIARIIPEIQKTCSGRDLAEALGRATNAGVDFDEWRNDLREAKSATLPPRDKWE